MVIVHSDYTTLLLVETSKRVVCSMRCCAPHVAVTWSRIARENVISWDGSLCALATTGRPGAPCKEPFDRLLGQSKRRESPGGGHWVLLKRMTLKRWRSRWNEVVLLLIVAGGGGHVTDRDTLGGSFGLLLLAQKPGNREERHGEQ